MQRRIMVLGCGGMLGQAVRDHFVQTDIVDATDIVLSDPWCSYQDIRDHDQLSKRVSDFKPDVIINLAAMTDLEVCERNPQDASDTNAMGSMYAASLASKHGLTYVYISTAGIFDGKKEYYSDEDVPNPICVYARTKYMGEIIATKVPKHVVLRCGWQFGSGPKNKKFVNKVWKQIKSGATELNVVQDKLGTPTYSRDFTRQIDHLLKSGKYGVYNAVCKGNASRYDVAVEMLNILGLRDKIKINIVSSDFWKNEYFAPRPPSEQLFTNKLDSEGLNIMRPWKECLKEYLTEEYKNYYSLETVEK